MPFVSSAETIVCNSIHATKPTHFRCLMCGTTSYEAVARKGAPNLGLPWLHRSVDGCRSGYAEEDHQAASTFDALSPESRFALRDALGLRLRFSG